jgi:UV DNA damage endonuclease
MYRLASGFAPYASHPDLPQFHGQVQECADELAAVGARARELGVRLSTHPGQYTVLNSENPAVVDAALAELEVHAALLDALGQGPEAVVVLHVGGAAGGRRAGIDRFCAGFERLSDAARRRLVVENDDRTYDVADVLAVSRRLGIPVVWDLLHHHCNDRERIPDREALRLALATWPDGVVPKIHFSSPRLDAGESVRRVGRRTERRIVLPDMRRHADLIDPIAFEQFLLHTAAGMRFDAMLEAKAKDLAVLALREQLAARGVMARA